MEINNDTILRGFLSHVQAGARTRATLMGAATDHPDNNLERQAERSRGLEPLVEQWNIIRRDIKKVLDVDLREFHELALPGSFEKAGYEVGFLHGSRDLFRITMGQFKLKCDKARIKDPSIQLMKSWDLKARKAPETEMIFGVKIRKDGKE